MNIENIKERLAQFTNSEYSTVPVCDLVRDCREALEELERYNGVLKEHIKHLNRLGTAWQPESASDLQAQEQLEKMTADRDAVLEKLQAVEAERDRYKTALIKGCDSGCDAMPDSKSYYCADCQQSITVCSDCHEILIGCDCGLCNIGAFFNEQD